MYLKSALRSCEWLGSAMREVSAGHFVAPGMGVPLPNERIPVVHSIIDNVMLQVLVEPDPHVSTLQTILAYHA
eukprot:3262247-Rhodomonas_salina.3